jgi:hypothetical protein
VFGNFVTMELALGVADTTDFGLADGVRASPEKFMTYVPNVPLIQPAIDQPPPAKYGDVPIIPAETTTSDNPDATPSSENSVTPAESGTNNASPQPKPDVDPF